METIAWGDYQKKFQPIFNAMKTSFKKKAPMDKEKNKDVNAV